MMLMLMYIRYRAGNCTLFPMRFGYGDSVVRVTGFEISNEIGHCSSALLMSRCGGGVPNVKSVESE